MIRVSSDNLIKVSQIENGKVRKHTNNRHVFDNDLSSVIKKADQGLSYEQKCSVGILSTEEYVKWMYEMSKNRNKL